MLPSFGKIIEQREQANADHFRRRTQELEPMLGDIPAHIVHEGRRNEIVRPSGKRDATEMRKHSGYIEVKRMPLSEFDQKFLNTKLDEMAKQLAESTAKAVIEALQQGADETGNVVDGKGRPFSQDLFLEVLSKMSHSFDEDGNWNTPTMIVAPDQMEKIRAIYESSTQKERTDYERKLAKIIANKKAEYDSEQAGRILAG
jgi:hypothetical protein